jgi:hypothetical protein
MTNKFMVNTSEISLVDEPMFRREGGEVLSFGNVDGATVELLATGSLESIRCLAFNIISHRTASR